MKTKHREHRNGEQSSLKSCLRFRKVGVAVMIAVTAAIGASNPPAQAQDKTENVTVTDARNMRFGEILVVKKTGVDIYNTTGLNDCPAELWDKMDLEQIKKEYGAMEVQKNGPHNWMMDTQTFLAGRKASFGGIEARYVATLPLATVQASAKGSAPYKLFTPKKTQKMVYAKGKPVFELVDPEGHVYVLEAHEAKFPIESLAKLGEQLKELPKGWKYQTRVLTEDLVMDLTPDQTIYAVGDEFHQYYTRPPAAK
jgi:hypothetical protein